MPWDYFWDSYSVVLLPHITREVLLIKSLSQGLCLEAMYVCGLQLWLHNLWVLFHYPQISDIFNSFPAFQNHWSKQFCGAELAIVQKYYIRAVQLLTKTAEYVHQAHNKLHISSLSPSITPLCLKRGFLIFPIDEAMMCYSLQSQKTFLSVAQKAANQAFKK